MSQLVPRFFTLLLVCFMTAAGGPFAFAQETANSVTLSGHVKDSTGGAIPGAQITLRDAGDTVQRTTVTDVDGHFVISGVSPGKYVLEADHQNFSKSSQEVVISSAEMGQPPLAITLQLAAIQQTLNVTASGAYAVPVAVGATKTDMPVMETPISVQVVPQAVLEDQQVVRLDQAIQNVSGVIPNNLSYGTADSFSIRGFDAQEMTYEDGLRLDQYSNAGFPIDMANVEKVEVVKGPASVMYGQAEPGGAVNIVTKKPLESPFYSLQQQFGSYGFYRTTFDATGPLYARKLFYRVPVDFQNAGSFRDFVHTNWFSMFPSLAWRPDDKTQLIVSFHYGTGSMVLDNGIPFLSDGTPANIPISRNLAEPNTNRTPTTEYFGKVLATRDIKNWQLRIAYRSDYRDSPAPNSVFYAGDADSNGDLQRYGFTENYFYHLTNQAVADVVGRFSWLGVKHSFLAGFDYYGQDGNYDANFYLPAPINIYNPVYGQPYDPPNPADDFYVHNGQTAYGTYIQDQISFPKNIFLLAGVRINWVNTYNNGYGQATDVTDHAVPTPRVGMLWKPQSNWSIFGSFTENYGATPLGNLTPDGNTLPPQSAQQFEAGVKSEWLQNRLVATASVYQITKQNIPTADPANPAYSIAIGEARSRGFELDVSGQLTPNWKIIGGYSYINAAITKDNNVPSLKGLPFPDVPYDSGSIWSVYEFPKGGLKGLKLGAGVVARTEQVNYESPDGVTYLTDRIPGFAIVNVMAGYTWHLETFKVSAQLNIYNLFNRTYFTSVNPSQAFPGAPITVLPSLRLEF
ncbi:MAG: TonB-dependent receptor [Terriglobia bacterium]